MEVKLFNHLGVEIETLHLPMIAGKPHIILWHNQVWLRSLIEMTHYNEVENVWQMEKAELNDGR